MPCDCTNACLSTAATIRRCTLTGIHHEVSLSRRREIGRVVKEDEFRTAARTGAVQAVPVAVRSCAQQQRAARKSEAQGTARHREWSTAPTCGIGVAQVIPAGVNDRPQGAPK